MPVNNISYIVDIDISLLDNHESLQHLLHMVQV